MNNQGCIAYNPERDYEEAYLPTPFASCHASNLLELPNGDWICAYFAGSREGNPDINIVMSRLPSGETCWTEPIVVSCDPSRSEQNPVFFLDTSSKLWLFYTSQDRSQDNAAVRCRTSSDLGHTWSEVKTPFDKPGSFIRQRVVILKDGSWMLPAYYSLKPVVPGGPSLGNDYSVVKRSVDNGQTWEEYEVPESRGLVHMTVVESKKGGYVAFFRSRWADFIYKSHSSDGLHWEAPTPTTLPNNNSSIQAINLSNGEIALACNPVCCSRYVPEGAADPAFFRWVHPQDRDGRLWDQEKSRRDSVWQPPRCPLYIFTSNDDGETWHKRREIESFPEGYDIYADPVGNASAQGVVNRRYSYPTILEGSDGMLHITYSYCRDCIKYVKIPLL